MQILGLIFAKTCIFFYTYTWRATLKIRWSGVITVFIGILMRLLKQYFFKGVTSLFGSYPLSLYHTLSSFWSSPLPPRRVTYFLNDPSSNHYDVSIEITRSSSRNCLSQKKMLKQRSNKWQCTLQLIKVLCPHNCPIIIARYDLFDSFSNLFSLRTRLQIW